jgi:hypothetical protein
MACEASELQVLKPYTRLMRFCPKIKSAAIPKATYSDFIYATPMNSTQML